MAEAVLRDRLAAAGLADRVQVASAGTGDHFAGRSPEPRAVAAAAERGYDLGGIRARAVTAADFRAFECILAADQQNLRDLAARRPSDARATLDLVMAYAPGTETEIPDPFEGPDSGFALALDRIEAAADGIVAAVRADRL